MFFIDCSLSYYIGNSIQYQFFYLALAFYNYNEKHIHSPLTSFSAAIVRAIAVSVANVLSLVHYLRRPTAHGVYGIIKFIYIYDYLSLIDRNRIMVILIDFRVTPCNKTKALSIGAKY